MAESCLLAGGGDLDLYGDLVEEVEIIPANLRYEIDQEFRRHSRATIFYITEMSIAEIARKMEVSREVADKVRLAARKWLAEAWEFEKRAGERE